MPVAMHEGDPGLKPFNSVDLIQGTEAPYSLRKAKNVSFSAACNVPLYVRNIGVAKATPFQGTAY
jgi:hypothetical protein